MSEIYAEDVDWKATAEALQQEVNQLSTEQHEMTCPSCQTTIRSRLADSADRAELDRLRELERILRERLDREDRGIPNAYVYTRELRHELRDVFNQEQGA
jgi:predicted kinase